MNGLKVIAFNDLVQSRLEVLVEVDDYYLCKWDTPEGWISRGFHPRVVKLCREHNIPESQGVKVIYKDEVSKDGFYIPEKWKQRVKDQR